MGEDRRARDATVLFFDKMILFMKCFTFALCGGEALPVVFLLTSIVFFRGARQTHRLLLGLCWHLNVEEMRPLWMQTKGASGASYLPEECGERPDEAAAAPQPQRQISTAQNSQRKDVMDVSAETALRTSTRVLQGDTRADATSRKC